MLARSRKVTSTCIKKGSTVQKLILVNLAMTFFAVAIASFAFFGSADRPDDGAAESELLVAFRSLAGEVESLKIASVKQAEAVAEQEAALKAAQVTRRQTATNEVPFHLSEVVADWKLKRDLLERHNQVVPTIRFRATATSEEPINDLSFKVVYFLGDGKGGFDVFGEDITSAVSPSNLPLEKGHSKSVQSEPAKGFKIGQDSTAALDESKLPEVRAELHYSVGDEFITLITVDVDKQISN